MKQVCLAGGMIALMSSTAFAQSTQGHAAGHADVTIDAARTSRSSTSNPGITTGINHRASVGSGGERPTGSPSMTPKPATGPNP